MKPSHDEALWNLEELLGTSLSSNSSSIPCLCVNLNLFLPSLHLSLLICKMRRIILSISGSFFEDCIYTNSTVPTGSKHLTFTSHRYTVCLSQVTMTYSVPLLEVQGNIAITVLTLLSFSF